MNVIRDFAAHIADTIEELEDYTEYSLQVDDDWTYKLYRNCECNLVPKLSEILGTEPLDYESIVDKIEEFINEEWDDNIAFEGDVIDDGYYQN